MDRARSNPSHRDLIDPRDRRGRVDQERRLFQRYQARHDPLDRELLVRRFMPLARALAARFRHGIEPMDDLIQVACLGLLCAIDRFELDRGTAFSSYAVPTIVGELQRHFRDHAWSLHVPRDTREHALKVRITTAKLWERHGRPPTVTDVAHAARLTVEQVVEARRALLAYEPVSLDARVSADEDGRVIADTVGVTESGYSRAERTALLDGLLPLLTARQREVLRLRFREDLTQREIGERVGLSQMQISRVLRQAVQRLSEVAVAC
jgi:RNA polymerase sigma-B factor